MWATEFFAGKTVAVVGGSSGIGLAIAVAFRDAGAVVYATGATDAELAGVKESGITFQRLDVADAGAVRDFAAGFASLSALVNCAGIIRRGEELDPEVFARVVDINLTGSMRTAAAFRPLLAASHGAILNTASLLSFFGGGLVPGYSASKGGVAQLTKSLAIAYAPDGIRVNAVAPGWIATGFTEALQNNDVRSAAILSRTPLGRWGAPEDIAPAALFLCSPLARFITGAILPVDGGYLTA